MRNEIFIAQRLKLGDSHKKGSPSITIALVGIVLAIVIMIFLIIVSIVVVSNAALGIDDNIATVDGREVFSSLLADSTLMPQIHSMSLMAEKPAILKTESDFNAVIYQGVDDGFDWSYLQSCLVDGRVPSYSDTANVNEILMSRIVADKLQLTVYSPILLTTK